MAGGGKKEKKKQETYWNQQARTANQQIAEKSELEKALEKKSLDRLNWEKEGRTDISDPRAGLQNYIQIGQAALNRAKRERMGTGALQLGNAGNAGHVANLKEQYQNEAAQEFGAGLERADALAHSEATGSVMPLAQLSTNRNIARANHAAGMFGQWSNKKAKSWWDYMKEGVGMATDVGSLLFGGGGGN